MAEYADYDFAQMRSDAVRRVEEMKKRSKTYLERENTPHGKGVAQPPAQKEAKTAAQGKKACGALKEPAREEDNDTFILLLLILILSQEGADQSLIFALLYMLL